MSKSSEENRLFKLLKAFEEFYKPWIEELWYLRIPTFGAVLSFLSFWVIDQTVEVYRVFALNAFIEARLPNIQDWQTFLSFFFIFILSFSIWYSARKLSKKLLNKKEAAGPEKYLALILGALPPLAFVFGLVRAALQAFQAKSIQELIVLSCWIVLVIILCCVMYSLVINFQDEIIKGILAFLLSCLALALFLLVFIKGEVASILGSVSIVAIFLSVFVIGSSSLLYWGYKSKFPIITFLVFILIGSSWLDLNDNHRIRQLESPSPHTLLTLDESFLKWKEVRKNEILAFEKAGKRYPIYIVSAQGGGIFAAYHAASTLSRLQDLCPAFANHVFAISGVSGGSLGAAVFSSLINTELKPYSGMHLNEIRTDTL
ncbi:MAG: hypothetical protein V7K71_28130 [Nostoc sp.]|uniref:hypothetical protein n=1 Tax=Nostoc sp. TaxID=1180 RepID=UPI002FF840CA